MGFCKSCRRLLGLYEFLVLHFELLGLVLFKLWGSWLNTFHVSPSQSVRLQWTEGPSSSDSHSAQLCPILHLRSRVIEHYQFWQLPRATGIWVLPPFTHPKPQNHIQTHMHTPFHTRTHVCTVHKHTECARTSAHTLLNCLSIKMEEGWKWMVEQKMSK